MLFFLLLFAFELALIKKSNGLVKMLQLQNPYYLYAIKERKGGNKTSTKIYVVYNLILHISFLSKKTQLRQIHSFFGENIIYCKAITVIFQIMVMENTCYNNVGRISILKDLILKTRASSSFYIYMKKHLRRENYPVLMDYDRGFDSYFYLQIKV